MRFDFISVYKAVNVFKKSLELVGLVEELTSEEFTLVVKLLEKALEETERTK